MSVSLRLNARPAPAEFAALWEAAWRTPWRGDLEAIWARSLGHFGAYAGGRLVGYVNVAGDGGAHAFILDTTVDPAHRRRGIGSELVRAAAELARQHRATWLHVDYEPHLEAFYRGCGLRPTSAGLLRLQE